MNVQKAEQAVKRWQDEVSSLSDLEKQFTDKRLHAMSQLDQALKELEEAKRPKVWEGDFANGVDIAPPYCSGTRYDYPCKVTVRPLGGPEPVVIENPHVADVGFGCQQIIVHTSDIPHLVGKRVRIVVEEV